MDFKKLQVIDYLPPTKTRCVHTYFHRGDTRAKIYIFKRMCRVPLTLSSTVDVKNMTRDDRGQIRLTCSL